MKEIEPCVFIPGLLAKDTLTQVAVDGKRNLEPFHAYAKEHKLPIDILEDSKFTGNVEIHRDEADLWGCIEGEVTFIVGGKAKDAKVREKNGVIDDLEIRATEIVGGTEHILHAGDWLLIPAGQPHQHKTESMARLWIIKIPALTPVPLEKFELS